MNIVYCVPHVSGAYGGLRVIFEQANRLQRRGHKVEVWTLMPPDEPLFTLEVDIRQIPHDYDFTSQNLVRIHTNGSSLLNPDVYIAGSFSTVNGYKSLGRSKPFWLMQHDEGYTIRRAPIPVSSILSTYNQAIKSPVKKICVSKWVRDRIRAESDSRAKIVLPGIDKKIFRPAPPAMKFDANSKVVVAVYSPTDWKGIDDLYAALKRSIKSHKNLRLILISAYTSVNVPEGVPTTVFINPKQTELKRIYSAGDVFISSSWVEGFGLPGLEAMACGVPLITTNSGGIEEYASKKTAIVVAPQEPDKLSEELNKLLESPSSSARLVKSGIEVAKTFDWDESIDTLEKIILN